MTGGAMKILRAIVIMLLASSALAQQKKPTFTCPSAAAKQACASFLENKDEVATLKDGDRIVCFREGMDEYFTVGLLFGAAGGTYEQRSQSVQSAGMVSAWTTNHGIEDDSEMPLVFLSGMWIEDALGSIMMKPSDSQTGMPSFSISGDAVSFYKQYENTKNSKIAYNLTLSTQTGRFHEVWRDKDGDSFLEHFGRCTVTKFHTPDYYKIRKEAEKSK
jgi:hypothetical protein